MSTFVRPASPVSVIGLLLLVRPDLEGRAVADPPVARESAMDRFADVLADTRAAVDRSLKPLAEAELAELRRLLYPLTTDHSAGHTFADRKQGRCLSAP